MLGHGGLDLHQDTAMKMLLHDCIYIRRAIAKLITLVGSNQVLDGF